MRPPPVAVLAHQLGLSVGHNARELVMVAVQVWKLVDGQLGRRSKRGGVLPCLASHACVRWENGQDWQAHKGVARFGQPWQPRGPAGVQRLVRPWRDECVGDLSASMAEFAWVSS